MNDLFRHAASCIRQNHRLLEHWTSNFSRGKSIVLESITNNTAPSSPTFFVDLLQSSSPSSQVHSCHHVNELNQMANQIFDTLLISTNEPGFTSSSSSSSVVNDPNIQNLIEFRQSFLSYFPSSPSTKNNNYHSLFPNNNNNNSSSIISEFSSYG